jgi:peptidoglycan/xylan/chitin deacetylase (PgdA/CDA1 family)
MAIEETARHPRPSSRPSRKRRTPRVGPVFLAVVLGIIAALILPAAHANLNSIASVNGGLVLVYDGSTVSSVAEGYLASAKEGSSLDITGDVVVIGGETPIRTEVDGRPASARTMLSDGSVVTVGHGESALERLVEKAEEIPFETVISGTGVIVRQAQAGSPGKRSTYLGATSRKQAAAFVSEAPKDQIIERTSTAKKGQKLAALTFDDGPDRWTQGVLDALAAKNVPATFFFLGGNAVGNQAMVQKVRNAGHELANHSWSHPQLDKLSADQIRREIERTEAVIGKTRFLRPPYGSYNTTVASVASSMGYDLVLWTVDTLDWKNRNADAILANVKAQTGPGAIILMHDGGGDRSATVAAVPRVIDWLLSNGYSLTTMSNLL